LRVGLGPQVFITALIPGESTIFAEFHLAGSLVTSTPAGCSDGRNPRRVPVV
jgi:hypothetical protein